jgi:hypothetical protein
MQVEEKAKRKDEVVARVVEFVIRKLNLEKVVYETIKEFKLAKEFGGEDEEY